MPPSVGRKALHALLRSPRIVAPVGRALERANRPSRKHNVILFHAGRSGSTALSSMLLQHPDIGWGGEVFSRAQGKYGARAERWMREDPMPLLRLRTYASRSPVYGFEVKGRDTRMYGAYPHAVERWAEQLGYDVFVLLTRKNLLRQVLSAVSGKSSGYWNSQTKPTGPAPKVEIVPEYLPGRVGVLELFERIESFYADVRTIYGERGLLELSFEEDIKTGPAAAFHKILDRLDLPSQEVTAKTHRLSKDTPLSDRIRNFDEIAAMLEGTRYEWMLSA